MKKTRPATAGPNITVNVDISRTSISTDYDDHLLLGAAAVPTGTRC